MSEHLVPVGGKLTVAQLWAISGRGLRGDRNRTEK